MRGLTIDPDTANEIDTMVTKGAGKEGAWKSIEKSEKIIKWSTVELLKIGMLIPRKIVIKY